MYKDAHILTGFVLQTKVNFAIAKTLRGESLATTLAPLPQQNICILSNGKEKNFPFQTWKQKESKIKEKI